MKKTTNLVWGGRFKKESSDLLKKINNSIEFDYQLASQDIKLNKSYAKSLRNCKIISEKEFKKIFNALEEILNEEIYFPEKIGMSRFIGSQRSNGFYPLSVNQQS